MECLPLSNPSVQEIADQFDPNDGFRVISSRVGDTITLHIGFYVNGKLSPLPVRYAADDGTCEVYRKVDPKPEDFGDMARRRLLLEAFCRYINTGGRTSSVCDFAAMFMRVLSDTQFVLPGLKLISSAFNQEGVAEHVFYRSDADPALLWVEDDFVDAIPLNEINRWLDESESFNVYTESSNPYIAALLNRTGSGTSSQIAGRSGSRLSEQGV